MDTGNLLIRFSVCIYSLHVTMLYTRQDNLGKKSIFEQPTLTVPKSRLDNLGKKSDTSNLLIQFGVHIINYSLNRRVMIMESNMLNLIKVCTLVVVIS